MQKPSSDLSLNEYLGTIPGEFFSQDLRYGMSLIKRVMTGCVRI